MGIRGEIFSQKVILPNRTYFFNVKENRLGDLYLNIVESKNRDSGGFDRQSVILFADDLQEFLKGFEESLKVMEKSMRGKKRGDNDKGGERKPRAERTEREERPKKFVRANSGATSRGKFSRERSGDRSERSERKPRSDSGERRPRGEYNGERKPRSERSFSSERKPRGAGSGAGRSEREGHGSERKGRGGERKSGGKRVVLKRDRDRD